MCPWPVNDIATLCKQGLIETLLAVQQDTEQSLLTNIDVFGTSSDSKLRWSFGVLDRVSALFRHLSTLLFSVYKRFKLNFVLIYPFKSHPESALVIEEYLGKLVVTCAKSFSDQVQVALRAASDAKYCSVWDESVNVQLQSFSTGFFFVCLLAISKYI